LQKVLPESKATKGREEKRREERKERRKACRKHKLFLLSFLSSSLSFASFLSHPFLLSFFLWIPSFLSSFLPHPLLGIFLSFFLAFLDTSDGGAGRTRRKRELGNKGVGECRRRKEAARKQTLKNWLAGLWNSAVDRYP
jgi:hypothetical protein